LIRSIISFLIGVIFVVCLDLLSEPLQNEMASLLHPLITSAPVIIGISDLILMVVLGLFFAIIWQRVFKSTGIFPDQIFLRRNVRVPLLWLVSVLPIWILFDQYSETLIEPYLFYLGSYFIFDWVFTWLSGRDIRSMFPLSLVSQSVYRKADDFWKADQYLETFQLLIPRAFRGDVEAQTRLANYLGESRWGDKYLSYEAIFAAQASNNDRMMAHRIALTAGALVTSKSDLEWDFNMSLILGSSSADDGFVPSLIEMARLMTCYGSDSTEKDGFEIYKRLIDNSAMLSEGNGCSKGALSTVYNNLGICYREGLGVDQNQSLAEECFEKAKSLSDAVD